MKDYQEQIDNNFKSHVVGESQRQAMDDIRSGCKALAIQIDVLCPDGREKSLALTNLEQVMFWANAAIARKND